MDPEAVFVTVVENYFTEERAFWASPAEVQGLRTRAGEMSASLVGKKGPDVTANDPTGTPRSIYEIKAPYVVVFLFNPTCDNCMIETPKLVRFYQEWKSKGVEVYAIAIDTDDAEWKAYVKKNNMNWINVFDPSNRSIYGKYYVDHTPELYVLNPDRTIIAKNLKTEQIQTVIERDQRKRAGK
jgi:peroxiredoxin